MAKKFNIHDWQAKQRLTENKSLEISPEEMEQLHKNGKIKLKDGSILVFVKENELAEDYSDKEESMSNEDIAALERIVKKYNMGKIQNVIKIFADKMNEASTTGTGASFQAGSGEAYATPYAFKKKRKDRMDEVSYRDFKRNTESSPRQKIAKGISQVGRMIKEIEKIVNHNFRLKTELDMNSGTFMKSTNKRIHELGAQLKRLENKLREFSN